MIYLIIAFLYLVIGNFVFLEVYKIFVKNPKYMQSKLYFKSSSYVRFIIYFFIVIYWFPYIIYYMVFYFLAFLAKYYDNW